MALESPTNCWTNATQVIADSIPQCAGFRSLTGAADATAAAAFVFQRKLSNYTREEVFALMDIENLATYAIVFCPTTNPYSLRRGLSGVYEPSGTVVIAVQRALLPTDASRFTNLADEEDRYFENRVGNMLSELCTYTDNEKTLRITQVDAVDATVRVRPSQRESEGDLQRATIVIQWAFQGP